MIEVETRGLNELLEALNNASDNLPKEVYSALNAASTKVRSAIAKQVTSEVAVPAKIVRKQTRVEKNRQDLVVTVRLMKSKRIPLRDFKARQTKTGVSARLKKGGKLQKYNHAFIVDKYGGHVFIRSQDGKGPRNPIIKMQGVSPYGVIRKNLARRLAVTQVAQEEVIKQMARRLRFVQLKQKGQLNWQADQAGE